MGLSMRVFTLNCGNGSLGKTAAKEIVEQFADTDADLFILNCQEVNFDKALKELANLHPEAVVLACPPMVTHTKPLTHAHRGTGMMTIIIHKRDLNVAVVENKQARRGTSRFSGSGYNKGGALTRIVVSRGDEKFTIDNTNAHLDAFSDATRAKDWANVHRLQKYYVTDWKELRAAIPDLSCSGFDANTRNKFSSVEMEVHLGAWENPIDWDMKSLVMAPLGNARESQVSTYKNHQPKILDEADPKRPNRTRGGMVDLVAYTDVVAAKKRLESRNSALVESSAISLPPKENESRDHAVIGSKEIIITKKRNFDRVREAIACSLVEAAPQLAAHLLSDDFEKSKENKDFLLEVYQRYLTPEGLLQKYLQLHAERLRILEQFRPQNPEAEEQFKQQLFLGPQPWFIMDEDESLLSLEQNADYHLSVFMLLNLHCQFLHESASKEECESLQLIVEGALAKMPKDLPQTEQQKWVKQINQLLSINKLLYSYDRHLQQETKNASKEEPDILLGIKVDMITSLKQTLKADKNPEELLSDIDTELDNEVRPMLTLHRNDDFLTQLYHKLRKLITGSDLSYGGFFVAETTKILIEEPASGTAPNIE